MSRRRTNHVEDAAVAREVLAATGDVIGARIDVIESGARQAPELSLVRHAAAVALVMCGWSRERVGRSISVDNHWLVRNKIGERLRVGAPKVLQAAVEAAKRATAKTTLRGIEAEATALMRRESQAAGLSVSKAATSKSRAARLVRVRVAQRLYASNYGGTQIAKVMGYGETTVYRWLSSARTESSTAPSC